MASPLNQERRPPSINRDDDPEAGRTVVPQQMALLVTGKTGNGKSALCNTIAGGQESVLDQDIFPTAHSMRSATTQMQYHDTHTEDCILRVVDTPDVTNLDWAELQMQQEVQTWKTTIRDFPYVVLLAVRCDVRYTAEEYQVYREFLRLWGDDSVKSSLVVAFTFGDRQDGDIGEALKNVCQELKNVLDDAGWRYVVFNNKADAEKKIVSVNELLKTARCVLRNLTLPRTLYPAIVTPDASDAEEGRTGASRHLALLVIGKTGNGKSSLCNTVAADKQFFPTGASMSSETTEMKYLNVTMDEYVLMVVDTPDVSNSEWKKRQMQQEVHKWKTTICDFPYVVLLAVRCDVRYTAEEYTVYNDFLRLWGDDSVKSRLVVAFTFGDRLDGDIEEELKTVCPELKNVLKDAGDRRVVFNNKADTSAKKVTVKCLLKMAPIIQVEETPLPHAYAWECVQKALIVFTVIILVIVIGMIVGYLDSLNWVSIGLCIGVIVLCLVFAAILVAGIGVHVREKKSETPVTHFQQQQQQE